MTDVKIEKIKKTIMKVEKKYDAGKFVRVTSSITDKLGLTGVVLEVTTGFTSEKLSLPQDRLHWLRTLNDAISETLEELEKILPAE